MNGKTISRRGRHALVRYGREYYELTTWTYPATNAKASRKTRIGTFASDEAAIRAWESRFNIPSRNPLYARHLRKRI